MYLTQSPGIKKCSSVRFVFRFYTIYPLFQSFTAMHTFTKIDHILNIYATETTALYYNRGGEKEIRMQGIDDGQWQWVESDRQFDG